MDDRQFDDLSRIIGGTSRRTALRLVAGAAVAVALGRTSGASAAIGVCRPRGASCRYNRQCCSRECEHHRCVRHHPED